MTTCSGCKASLTKDPRDGEWVNEDQMDIDDNGRMCPVYGSEHEPEEATP